jgi:ribosomal protein S18 acetylase RimI-like enzyme
MISISIRKAEAKDAVVLADIGARSFVESHEKSATKETIDSYVKEKYTVEAILEDLNKPESIYHILYFSGEAAGYSKIIFNQKSLHVTSNNFTCLDRLYFLKKFYDKGLGLELLQFNIDLSKKHDELGMWLFAWTGNERAINFYKKYGFNIVGDHRFKITETHSNPNYQMLLAY